MAEYSFRISSSEGFLADVTVRQGASANELKTALEATTGIPIGEQRLFHSGRELCSQEDLRAAYFPGSTAEVYLQRRAAQYAKCRRSRDA